MRRLLPHQGKNHPEGGEEAIPEVHAGQNAPPNQSRKPPSSHNSTQSTQKVIAPVMHQNKP